MLFVLFFTCSIVNTHVCRQELIQISQEPVPPMTCVMYAQPQLARWKHWHPNQDIKKFKCVDGERLEKERERSL